MPGVTYFKPAGIPMKYLEEVQLTVEELEAVRLKDLEGMEQEEGGKKMNVSRPTFQRILASARKKTADALLNGKAIRIEGGNYEMAQHRFKCRSGHEWQVDNFSGITPAVCPTCDTADIKPVALVHPGRGGNNRRKYVEQGQ